MLKLLASLFLVLTLKFFPNHFLTDGFGSRSVLCVHEGVWGNFLYMRTSVLVKVSAARTHILRNPVYFVHCWTVHSSKVSFCMQWGNSQKNHKIYLKSRYWIIKVIIDHKGFFSSELGSVYVILNKYTPWADVRQNAMGEIAACV